MRCVKSLLLLTGFLTLLAVSMTAPAFADERPNPATYEARGVLKSLDVDHRQAVIAHDEIRGYMAAMTMSFDFHESEAAAFRELQPGDAIAFRLSVAGDEAWIDRVQKRAGETPAPLDPPRPGDRLRLPGDAMPDIALIDQYNKSRRLSDFHGAAVAVTFIYTRCPLPTYCPLVGRNFHVAEALLQKLAPEGNWRLLSISLDPEHDDAPALEAYARQQGANEQDWVFANADAAALAPAAVAIGLQFTRQAGQITHNLRTVVLDRDGRIRKIFEGNRWTPQELAAEVVAATRVGLRSGADR